MQDIVGKENYFIEIQNHGLQEQLKITNQLIDIANKIGAKIVPTGDCHYVHKADAHAHDIMLCVATNSNIYTENRFSFSGDNFYLKSYEEMSSVFSEEWLKNTLHVSDMVDLNLSFGDLYFPNYPIPENKNVNEYLESLVWSGLKTKYGSDLSQEIVDRTNHELRVVKEMGFPEYFLVVSDLVNWAKDNGIRVGWGRGSAAGSILSYGLGITNLDPLKFGLLFERFLVEGRKSMPDIDLDFDDRYRDKVIEYAKNKYGTDRVAHICTFNKTGAKQSIRDAARALGYDFSTGDKVSKLVPPPVLGVSKNLGECMQVDEFVKEYNSSEDSKKIVDAAFGLEGLVRQTGVHAAGVVISRGPLTDYLPIMQKGAESPIVTQWDMGRVEQCGLLKIDFLGLRNLGVIDQCIKLVEKNKGISIDLDLIPLDDKKTFSELCKGNSIGVFQLESSGMRQLMVQLQPQDIKDIMALISLYRPGPMGSGMDKMYINRKHGRSAIDYDHPAMKSALQDSLGIMLYQEDVLAVARELAGFSVSEADDLRKVIGKKQMDKIPKLRKKFVDGCLAGADITEEKANKIFSDIEYFGGYGFNRAHAASYAMVSYITAYLKTHYTAEYMAALLTSVAGNKDKSSVYLSDCKKMGIKVLPPSINKSLHDFEVISDQEILFGLSAVNGIGPAIADALIECRDEQQPYHTMHDFFRRVDSSVLKKSTIEHLGAAGAFDELVSVQDEEPITRRKELELLEKEKSELGIYVSKHPIEGLWDLIKPNIEREVFELEECTAGSKTKIGGIVSSVKKTITKKGMKMFKLNVEDMTSGVEVIIFPKEAKSLPDDFFTEGDILIISGTVLKEGDDENAVAKVVYSSSEKVNGSVLTGSKPIILKVDSIPSNDILQSIYDIINKANGSSVVFIEVTEENKKYTFRFNKTTSLKVESQLQDIIKLG
jgi:DNA polymerase-3 subunit alpha